MLNRYTFLNLYSFQVNHYKWVDGNPFVYSEWYDPSKDPSVPWVLEKLIHPNPQPISDGFSHCTIMFPYHPQEKSNWVKVPCNYPIKETSFICKTDSIFNKSSDTFLTSTSGYLETNTLAKPLFACPAKWTYVNGTCLRLITSPYDLSVGFSWPIASRYCYKYGGKMYPKLSDQLLDAAQLSSLLQKWQHREMYGHIWIFGPTKLYYNSKTQKSVSSCPVIFSGYNGKGNYYAMYGELDCSGLKGLATFRPFHLNNRHRPLTPKPWHVLCETDVIKINNKTSCLPFHHTCDNGVCVSPDSICDGLKDCDDGEDEKNCTCGKDNFQCNDGTCIPVSNYCNHIQNCNDRSDETECVFKECNQKEFRCQDGQCIRSSERCNFQVDCMDESDESECNFEDFRAGFLCYSDTCIPKSKKNDLIQDCPGPIAEDEIRNNLYIFRGVMGWSNRNGAYAYRNIKPYCPQGGVDAVRCEWDHVACFQRRESCIYDHDEGGNTKGCRNHAHLRNCTDFECPSHFKCPETYCIPYRKVCNGEWDCPDGYDEKGCASYHCPGLFRCKGGRHCISLNQVCDGVVHCEKFQDDENYCEYILSPCPNNCKCTGYAIDCSLQNLSSLPKISSKSRSLILHGNVLNMTNNSLSNFIYLARLDLSHNDMTELFPFMFSNQVNLLELDLTSNKISQIKEHTFKGLALLRSLWLQGNGIQSIESNSFLGPSSLSVLDLSNQKILHVEVNAFNGLDSLTRLKLQTNQIKNLQPGVFSGLGMITDLEIQQNSLENIELAVFYDLKKLTRLDIDAYKFCCLVSWVNKCSPAPDEFSTCSDLLSASELQIGVWILGVLSVVGNLFVVIWRSVKEKRTVASTLILNLGLSDFLMGVYLVIIASADTYYRGVYIMHADKWRSSITCNLAGFLSMVSSEVSVFTMVIMTVDRVMMVVFPFKCVKQKLNLKSTVFICSFGWVLCTFVGLVPIFATSIFHDFYGQNGVCLPFTLRNVKLSGWEYSFAIFNIINSIAFLIIAVGYVLIYCSVRSARKESGGHSFDENVRLARKITLIIMTDFLCWMPIIILSFMATFGVFIPGEVSAWVAIIVLPINSAVNPVLYTISALKLAKQVKPANSFSSRSKVETSKL